MESPKSSSSSSSSSSEAGKRKRQEEHDNKQGRGRRVQGRRRPPCDWCGLRDRDLVRVTLMNDEEFQKKTAAKVNTPTSIVGHRRTENLLYFLIESHLQYDIRTFNFNPVADGDLFPQPSTSKCQPEIDSDEEFGGNTVIHLCGECVDYFKKLDANQSRISHEFSRLLRTNQFGWIYEQDDDDEDDEDDEAGQDKLPATVYYEERQGNVEEIDEDEEDSAGQEKLSAAGSVGQEDSEQIAENEVDSAGQEKLSAAAAVGQEDSEQIAANEVDSADQEKLSAAAAVGQEDSEKVENKKARAEEEEKNPEEVGENAEGSSEPQHEEPAGNQDQEVPLGVEDAAGPTKLPVIHEEDEDQDTEEEEDDDDEVQVVEEEERDETENERQIRLFHEWVDRMERTLRGFEARLRELIRARRDENNNYSV